MENKEFGKILGERTLQFAVDIILFSVKLPNSDEARILRNQITKSGTSIGANYAEANRAKSKADFSHKIKICEGEANETVYWLSVISRLNWVEKEIWSPLLDEATQLLAIFTSINGRLRNKKDEAQL